MPKEDRPTGTEPVPASPRPGKPIYLGIDLGTTNSSAAVFDGESVQTVRGSHGGGITPSVVRIDRAGRVQVGHRARRQLDLDPDNTALEFKQRIRRVRH